jgi:hypothetical protein
MSDAFSSTDFSLWVFVLGLQKKQLGFNKWLQAEQQGFVAQQLLAVWFSQSWKNRRALAVYKTTPPGVAVLLGAVKSAQPSVCGVWPCEDEKPTA